jgi:hypothetical protein
LGKREEQVLPGSEGNGGDREGFGYGERNGPNNVCTSEYMNKEAVNKYIKIKIHRNY